MSEFDLSLAMRRFPLTDDVLSMLPEGQVDTTVNRSLLAKSLGTSENTITKWIERGLPVQEEGGNGREYKFSLAECYAWRMWRDEKSALQREASERAVNQLALSFRNLDEDQDAGTVLTAKQIAEESEADYKRLKAAEQRGDLVRRHRVEELFERIIVAYRNKNTAVVDFAEIEFSLSPEEVEKLQGFMDQICVQARIELEHVVSGQASVTAISSDKQGSLPV